MKNANAGILTQNLFKINDSSHHSSRNNFWRVGNLQLLLLANSLGIHYVGNCSSPVAQTIASAVAHQLNGWHFSVETNERVRFWGIAEGQKKKRKKKNTQTERTCERVRENVKWKHCWSLKQMALTTNKIACKRIRNDVSAWLCQRNSIGSVIRLPMRIVGTRKLLWNFFFSSSEMTIGFKSDA